MEEFEICIDFWDDQVILFALLERASLLYCSAVPVPLLQQCDIYIPKMCRKLLSFLLC